MWVVPVSAPVLSVCPPLMPVSLLAPPGGIQAAREETPFSDPNPLALPLEMLMCHLRVSECRLKVPLCMQVVPAPLKVHVSPSGLPVHPLEQAVCAPEAPLTMV